MGQKKLVRFAAIENMDNVLQHPEGMPGRWSSVFGNNHPITLELACGKGEYSVGQGRTAPNRNFLGIDIKGNRLFIGARIALREGLKNVAFMRAQIGQLTRYFAPGEVSEIWIVFPDPFLRKSRDKNRLTHPRFLHQYQQVLAPGGRIHLKTDSPELFAFTLEVIEEQGCVIHEKTDDVYAKGIPDGPLSIQTHYEGLHLADSRTIRYVQFSLPDAPIKMPDRFHRFEEESHADAADA